MIAAGAPWAAVRSASGGAHFYFPSDPDRPQRSWQAARAGIDFRGDGGYIMLPPSRNRKGHYRRTDQRKLLSISDIPWAGPTACVRVGQIDGHYVVNPTTEQLTRSRMDLVVAGTREAVMMVECGAQTVSEEEIVSAIEFAHAQMQPIIDLIEQMRAEVGQEKFNFVAEGDLTVDLVPELAEKARAGGLRGALLTVKKKDRSARTKAVRDAIIAEYVPDAEAEGAAERQRHLVQVGAELLGGALGVFE